ncbi:MAG: 50S ribosomal protein L11 methyltransferase [Bacteroidales bacterium]|nr:50S ribosomal protein L11 methyltransferase [Bacteroidales bacterium]MCF8333202.1 50S ribosomal protein L11 methyltransferase [Bacteroidales bacterium]
MNYIELHCKVFPAEPASDILTAQLAEIGYESFAESDTGLLAYIPADSFDFEAVKQLPLIRDGLFDVTLEYEEIEEENWNRLWESNYDPVLIDELCYIRAPFHSARNDVQYDIIIEPRMSFGTAHHETTELVIRLMFEEDFKGKQVLDMGSGTGILSILASKMGAKKITAIDVDQWAHENAPGNFRHNALQIPEIILGDVSAIPNHEFDMILANINRNVLISDLEAYAGHLDNNGRLLMSGFYEHDIELVKQEAARHGLALINNNQKNDWVALTFEKARQ